MNEKNTQYLDRYNKGSAYKHIGFEEAYEMMPKTQETNTQTQRQTREDNERQNKAGRVGGNTGTEAQSNARKPTVRQGATLDSIVERIENEW